MITTFICFIFVDKVLVADAIPSPPFFTAYTQDRSCLPPFVGLMRTHELVKLLLTSHVRINIPRLLKTMSYSSSETKPSYPEEQQGEDAETLSE